MSKRMPCLLTVGLFAAFAAEAVAVRAPEFRKTDGASASEVLVIGAGTAVSTGPFRVADKMDANVFGQMNKPEQKFLDNVSSATLVFDDKSLKVTVECPVPDGLQLETGNNAWCGDRVELLIRPAADDERFSAFSINAGGAYAAHGFKGPGTRDMGWSSASVLKSERTPRGYRVSIVVPIADAFGGRRPASGEAFGLNVRRFGRTCGGYSAWAFNGGAFNMGRFNFGTAISGSARPYFERRLGELKAKALGRLTDAAARAEAERVTASVGDAIVRYGDDAGNFASLERLLGELERAYLQIALGGVPLLLFHDASVWGDRHEPIVDSKPLEKLVIRVGRNTRAVRAFALANLGADDFVGEIKFFDRYDGFMRSGRPWQPLPNKLLLKHFTIRRGLPVSAADGHATYDPLVDLPLGQVLTVGAGKTAPLFAELDTHGARPGVYKMQLVVKPDTKGFCSLMVPVEVTVTDDDIESVGQPYYAYTHALSSFRYALMRPGVNYNCGPAKNYVADLASRGYNSVLLWEHDAYPRLGADGKWVPPDFTAIDAYLDAWVAGGLSRAKMRVQLFMALERIVKGRNPYTGFLGPDNRPIAFGTAAFDEGVRFMAKSYLDHLRERHGVTKDRVFFYPVDEASGDPDDAAFKSSMSRCLHAGRLLKAMDPELVTFCNPEASGNIYSSPKYLTTLKRLAEVYDYAMPYRPRLGTAGVKAFREAGFKHIWTYHISGKDSSAMTYRQPTWTSLADGFEPTVTYWHCDESATLDSSAAHPYGSIYVDWDHDKALLSRRQLGADMAREEGNLVLYLRRKHAKDAATLGRIESLVREGAAAASMDELESVVDRLQNLL